MDQNQERKLNFVLYYYRKGRLDSISAYHKWKIQHTSFYAQTHWVRYAVAACVLLCIVSSSIYLYLKFKGDNVELVASSNILAANLPDGSQILLSPGSSLQYDSEDFHHGIRSVSLHGTAFFEVKHDATRPFQVRTERTCTEVLGTRFQVVEKKHQVFAWVKDGKVRFSSRDAGGSVVLTAGESAICQEQDSVPKLVDDVLNPDAWRVGYFVYEHTPLSIVLKELSWHYDIRLSASDEQLELTATLPADDLRQAIRMIETVLQVKIIEN